MTASKVIVALTAYFTITLNNSKGQHTRSQIIVRRSANATMLLYKNLKNSVVHNLYTQLSVHNY